MGCAAAVGIVAAGVADAVASVGAFFAGVGGSIAGGLGLGATAGGLIGTGLEGATIGALGGGAIDAATGKPILPGVLQGALVGGTVGAAGPALGGALGIGSAGGDILAGAGAGALGGAVIPGAGGAAAGAEGGALSGAISGAVSGLTGSGAAGSASTGGPGASAAGIAAPASVAPDPSLTDLGGLTGGIGTGGAAAPADIYGGGGVAASPTGGTGIALPSGASGATAGLPTTPDVSTSDLGSLTGGIGTGGVQTPAGGAPAGLPGGDVSLYSSASDNNAPLYTGGATGSSSTDMSLGNFPQQTGFFGGSGDLAAGATAAAPDQGPITSLAGYASGGGPTTTASAPVTAGVEAAPTGASGNIIGSPPGFFSSLGGGGSAGATNSLIPGVSNSTLGTLGLGGALLGYDALKGNQPVAGEPQISAAAGQLGAQATQLEGYLTSGTLPPGVQTALNQAASAAQASIRSQYAARGMSGSSAEAADLANVQNTIVSQGVSIATNLLSQGINESQLSSQLYGQIMQTSLAQDQQLSSALATLAGAAARPTVTIAGTSG